MHNNNVSVSLKGEFVSLSAEQGCILSTDPPPIFFFFFLLKGQPSIVCLEKRRKTEDGYIFINFGNKTKELTLLNQHTLGPA